MICLLFYDGALPKSQIVPQFTRCNRDPKVIWHAPTQKWVMVFYVGLPEKRHTTHFFTSLNLRDWTLASMTQGGAREVAFTARGASVIDEPGRIMPRLGLASPPSCNQDSKSTFLRGTMV